MKATVEVPDDLYRRVTLRCALEGRPIREVTESLYRAWLEDEDSPERDVLLPPLDRRPGRATARRGRRGPRSPGRADERADGQRVLIAVDTNVLIDAHRDGFREHRQALAWLRHLAEGLTPWAMPVFCLGEFVRVATHPRVLDPPSTIEQALA